MSTPPEETAAQPGNPLLRAVPARALRRSFLMQVALLAIDRWDTLSPPEQARFRELARREGDGSAPALSKEERRELKGLWKRLEVSGLLRQAARLLTGRSAA